MKKVGIITFHASYNYGTVFQAQATQMILEKIGYNAEIIDYRPETYNRYDEIYCDRNKKGIIGRALSIGYGLHKRIRESRKEKFKDYEQKYLKLSKKRYLNYSELSEVANVYDVYVSGSDQIWSKYVPEIMMAGEDAVLAYYLGFTEKNKISYASSVAAMTEIDLEEFSEYLKKYSSVATREKIGAEKIEKVVGRSVEVVVDPTFLLKADEWKEIAGSTPIIKEKYVLLYSLRNYMVQRCWGKALKVFAKQHNLKIVVVAPYAEFKMSGAINMQDASPEEFLNLYANAEVVCTDTFHGTAFAVNFNKPFYSLGTKYWKQDIRKTNLLKLLQLEERLIDDESDITAVKDYSCDFTEANAILDRERKKSIMYLQKAVGE